MTTRYRESGDPIYHHLTTTDLSNSFTGYFQPLNQIDSALAQLATLKQGKNSVEKYIADFRLLISLAGMTTDTHSDNLHLITHFRRGLHPAIAKTIAHSESVPRTITGWAEKAITFDTNYRLDMAMTGKGSFDAPVNYGRGNSNNGSGRRDPNAMDVDAMTTEKRTALMKKGLCFKCEQKGHLAKDCPGKKKNNVKDIHALLTALSEEEKKELLALQGKNKDEDF